MQGRTQQPKGEKRPREDDLRQAHTLEEYLDTFRPVLTAQEILDLEARINQLRHSPE